MGGIVEVAVLTMSRRIAKYFASPGHLTRLAFWAAMFVGHIPSLTASIVDSVNGESGLVRLILNLATQIFFVLKIVDVPWLRLPSERRAMLSFCLIVLLLHGGVAQRMVSDDAAVVDPWQAIVLAGGCAALISARLSGTHRNHTAARVTRNRVRALLTEVFKRAEAVIAPPRFLLLARSSSVNRAPPA